MIALPASTCERGRMRQAVEVRLLPGDGKRRDGVVSDRRSAQHPGGREWMARPAMDGAATMAVRAETGEGKPATC